MPKKVHERELELAWLLLDYWIYFLTTFEEGLIFNNFIDGLI